MQPEKKSRPGKADFKTYSNGSTFDANKYKYMLKLPKTKKVTLSNGQIKWEQTEADYLPLAARIAWFRSYHPDWSIITKTVQLANKALLMKAIIKDRVRKTLLPSKSLPFLTQYTGHYSRKASWMLF